MLTRMALAFSLVLIAAMIYALVDIITRDEGQIRHLPKFAWAVLVILIPIIGVVLWFALGREYGTGGGGVPIPVFRTESRADAAPAPVRPSEARSTERQLAELEREIEEDRLRAELERRRGQAHSS